MVNIPNRFDITGEDLRAALKEMKGYVDITEEDLKKIYRSRGGTPNRGLPKKLRFAM